MKRIILIFNVLILALSLNAQDLRLGFNNNKDPFKWAENTPESCPLKRSKEYTEVVFSGRYANYTNADTWYPSWASDDNMYSPWTDGYILRDNPSTYVQFDWQHPDYPCNSLDFMGRKAATAQAKIVGNDPMNLTIENIEPRIEASPAPYGGRYPCGSLVYNGVWYYGTYCLTNSNSCNCDCDGVGWPGFGPFVGFRISKDYGKTWEETPCTPSNPLFKENPELAPIKIGAPHFVDFGKNMEHSPDGYAYLTAHGATDPTACNNWIQGDQIYLIRVKPDENNMNNMDAYEYYAGKNKKGKPVWTKDFSQIKPIIDWPGYLGCVTATYNPVLKKYFMCVSRGHRNWMWKQYYLDNRFDTMILVADRIDGEWKLLKYMDRFGPVAYFVNIPSKFISEDGKTMWLSYSANWQDKNMSGTPQGSHYTFSLHEFTIE